MLNLCYNTEVSDTGQDIKRKKEAPGEELEITPLFFIA